MVICSLLRTKYRVLYPPLYIYNRPCKPYRHRIKNRLTAPTRNKCTSDRSIFNLNFFLLVLEYDCIWWYTYASTLDSSRPPSPRNVFCGGPKTQQLQQPRAAMPVVEKSSMFLLAILMGLLDPLVILVRNLRCILFNNANKLSAPLVRSTECLK